MKPRGHPRFGAKKRERPEHDEQQRIKRLLDLAAIDYYDTSQPFQAFITPGLPDLRCFAWVPLEALMAFGNGASGAATYEGGRHWSYMTFEIETKAPGVGRQSPEQATYERRCEVSGHPYVLGGLLEVKAFLEAVGLAKRTVGGQWALWAVGVRVNRHNRIT